MAGEKLPPYDREAEEAVLGSLLVDGDSIYKVASLLTPDDFFLEQARWPYEACLSLYQRNEAINQITVGQELSRLGKIEGCGGIAYLSHLVSMLPTSLHIEHYGQIVRRLAVMRRLIAAGGQIAAIGYEAGPDVDASLDRAEDVLFRIRHGQTPRDFVHISQVLDRYFEESGLTPRQEGGKLPHVLTGFRKLDEFLGGLQRSDLIILAARPSMGKTSLALNIARNAAVRDGATVAIFSLEMTKEQLVQRLLSSEAGVDSKRIRLGTQTEAEEKKVIEATGVLSEASIYIDDFPQLRIVEMRSKARRLHFEKGIDLLIVDYLQLMQGSTSRVENRVQEISEITRRLKALSRELNVPLIAVSQLSRAVEGRASHKPQLSDLRESGSIEQDADLVLFIYRDEVYVNEEEWQKQSPDSPYPRGLADILVSKNRNGPVGDITLRFLTRFARFEDLGLQEAAEMER